LGRLASFRHFCLFLLKFKVIPKAEYLKANATGIRINAYSALSTRYPKSNKEEITFSLQPPASSSRARARLLPFLKLPLLDPSLLLQPDLRGCFA
jgi:hypothetical protein